MSECIIKIIGRKQSSHKKGLSFIARCSKQENIWFAEFIIEELISALKIVVKTIFLIPNFIITKIENYENYCSDSIQEEISEFFYKLRFREDFFCHTNIQELLLIPVQTLPIQFISSVKVSDMYTLTSFCMIPALKTLISSSEYISMFSGIGKLLSLIETSNLGEIEILGYEEDSHVI